MVTIILARHGETDWNVGVVFRGRADVPLNDTGLRQAELLGEYLSGEKIDVVYSSPLQRAVRTAEAIAARQRLDINIVANLNDIDCGQWQGLSLREVEEKYPELYQDWLDTPEQVRLPGGETLEEVRSRVVPFIEDAVMRCGEGAIVLVSHRVVHKVIIGALLGLGNASFWNFRLDTGGITRFEFDDGKVVLVSHNDTSYLRPVRSAPPVDF
jgi:broad specificity phosphatase PhoE